MIPTKRLSGFRFIVIRYGDTLQQIASRELGDPARWADIIAINNLLPPYITADPGLASPRVKLYGETIIIPAAQSDAAAEVDEDRVFLVDIRLRRGRLEPDETGDLALTSGVENFKQAVRHRIATPLRELLFHPTYGCEVHKLKGQGGLGGVAALAAGFIKSALASDNRVASVESASAVLSGDSLSASAKVQPISGTSVDIEAPI